MASKVKEVFEVRALKWGNLQKANSFPPVKLKGLELLPYAATSNSVAPDILSQPFQDRDGKVKYCRYNREEGKWDAKKLYIAQLSCGNQDTIFLGGC